MSNIYEFTRCACCQKATLASDEGVVRIRGALHIEEVRSRIDLGESMETIAADFCDYCGGKFPCGCKHPTPQSGAPTC